MTTNTDLHGAMPELPELKEGCFYETTTHGQCRYEGLDNYMGQITHQFYSLKYNQRIYQLPERLCKFLAPAARAAIQQAAVPEGLIACLRGGAQCDEDGTNIIMSRQACCEAADILERIATPAPPKQQPALGRGEGGGVPQPLLFSRRKGIADKLGVPMTAEFNAIVRETERAHGIDWPNNAHRPSAPTGQINPDSAGQGMEGGDHG